MLMPQRDELIKTLQEKIKDDSNNNDEKGAKVDPQVEISLLAENNILTTKYPDLALFLSFD